MKPSRALAALFPLLTLPTLAHADLTINLQFDSAGTTTKYLTPADTNTDIPVQVWAAVTGSGTLGIDLAFFRAMSQQIGSGAFLDGGVTSAGFLPLPTFNNGATQGTGRELSDPPDGITDLVKAPDIGMSDIYGNTWTYTPPEPEARAKPAPYGIGNGAYYTLQGGWATIPGGASIELGTFNVHIGALTGGGVTQFNVVIPPKVIPTSAIWFENAQSLDGKRGKIPSKQSAYSPGTSISFSTTANPPTITPPTEPTLSPINPVANTPMPTYLLLDLDTGFSTLTFPALKTLLHSVSPAIDPIIIAEGDPDPLNLIDSLMSQLNASKYAIFNADRDHLLLFEYTSIPDALNDEKDVSASLVAHGIGLRNSIFRTVDPATGALVALDAPEPTTAALLLAAALPFLSRNKSRHRAHKSNSHLTPTP